MKRSSTMLKRLGPLGVAAALAMVMNLAAVTGSSASFLGLGRPRAPTAAVTEAQIAQIQRALDEERYVDAGRLLDMAAVGSGADPRLMLLSGDLSLARGHYDDALADFKKVDTPGPTRGSAMEGEGIALSLLGRSDQALAMLQQAVTEDPSAWRAWNALGGEYDSRRDWVRAEAAYDHALTDSGQAPKVLNNRGFSRLLQNRLDDAVADFVAALQKKPDLAAARTNLRLAMAMKGQYDRATTGGTGDDRAALLNNAGYAAMLRGDYPKAEDLFTQAMQAKGVFYGRASANLDMAKSLAANSDKTASAGK
jgi:Flp pilus assembly protein TadD